MMKLVKQDQGTQTKNGCCDSQKSPVLVSTQELFVMFVGNNMKLHPVPD